MRCVLDSARKSLPCTSCLYFALLYSSEDCQNPRVCSLDAVKHHRLKELVTGHGEWSSAKHNGLGQTFFAGRHSTLPAGQIFLLNLFLTAAEVKT